MNFPSFAFHFFFFLQIKNGKIWSMSDFGETKSKQTKWNQPAAATTTTNKTKWKKKNWTEICVANRAARTQPVTGPMSLDHRNRHETTVKSVVASNSNTIYYNTNATVQSINDNVRWSLLKLLLYIWFSLAFYFIIIPLKFFFFLSFYLALSLSFVCVEHYFSFFFLFFVSLHFIFFFNSVFVCVEFQLLPKFF